MSVEDISASTTSVEANEFLRRYPTIRSAPKPTASRVCSTTKKCNLSLSGTAWSVTGSAPVVSMIKSPDACVSAPANAVSAYEAEICSQPMSGMVRTFLSATSGFPSPPHCPQSGFGRLPWPTGCPQAYRANRATNPESLASLRFMIPTPECCQS